MAVILNASTSSGLVQTADTSGTLELQSNGSTKLTVNSSGVTATNIQGTIVQGTAVASTSGTSIDFTSIPSWVKRITVMFSEVSTSGTSAPLIQLADAGGVEITGYVSTAMQVSTATPSTTNSTAGFIVSSLLAANIISGTYTFYLINGATYAWVGNGVFKASTVITSFSSGSKSLSDTLTQVRITTVNGTDTFDAGTINIQYEG
jgi:hypothetical protein